MNEVRMTKVRLLNVPLENDYKHTLYFTSKETQKAYFESRTVKIQLTEEGKTEEMNLKYDDFSYQRKDNVIKVYHHCDHLQDVNYVMYQNSKYTNKWYYAFVTKVEYINPELTALHIETDVIQTWLFDYNLKESFVEREHVSDDTIGLHILPEKLDIGDYICNSHYLDSYTDNLLKDTCYVMASTLSIQNSGSDSSPKFDGAGTGIYGGIMSGVKYYRYDSRAELDDIMIKYEKAGQSDGITGIFMAPKVWCPVNEEIEVPEGITTNFDGHSIQEYSTPQTYDINVGKNYGLNGYNPRNNKLKTFPFCYLLVSNNNGGAVTYNYEDFSTDNCQFVVKGCVTPGMSIRMTPKNYKGAEEHDEESINLGKYPICSYPVDMYTNWLTQNAVNIGLDIISGVGQVVGGAIAIGTGAGAVAGAGLIANGGMSIANTMGEIRKASLVPPQARGNLNAGDIVTASGKNSFHFYFMSIKKQYAEILDRYFDMFGYQVNNIKVPNKAHRSRYWYTKTIDVNIDGNMPNDDMQLIKNCYNNGITFWRNASEIQNYSLTNNPIA